MPIVRRWKGVGSAGYSFHCPGCDERHSVRTEGPTAWAFNGDVDKPTFKPSVLVRTGHHVPGHTGDCWCTYNAEHGETRPSFQCLTCHSHVTDGRIQFLADSTHALAGQTVDLPPIPDAAL